MSKNIDNSEVVRGFIVDLDLGWMLVKRQLTTKRDTATPLHEVRN